MPFDFKSLKESLLVVEDLANKEKLEVAVCNHEYRLIDNWQSDALGVPYGYKTYECTKCKHKDKKFWYV